jgi:hypothetical protein
MVTVSIQEAATSSMSPVTGVVLGGAISLLTSTGTTLLLAFLGRTGRRRQVKTRIRVIRFKLYAAQQELKSALESGTWWAPEADPILATAGEDLDALADLLPEEPWRTYTAAWRRLRECILRSSIARAAPATDSSNAISTDNLMHLLGTFATIDSARTALRGFVRDRKHLAIRLDRGQLNLTDAQVTQAQRRYASRLALPVQWTDGEAVDRE